MLTASLLIVTGTTELSVPALPDHQNATAKVSVSTQLSDKTSAPSVTPQRTSTSLPRSVSSEASDADAGAVPQLDEDDEDYADSGYRPSNGYFRRLPPKARKRMWTASV